MLMSMPATPEDPVVNRLCVSGQGQEVFEAFEAKSVLPAAADRFRQAVAVEDEEVADLREFFAQIEPSESAGTDWLVLLGLAGTAALLAVHGVLFAFIPKVSYSRKLRNSR